MEWRARKDHHQTCSTHALHTQAGTYMRATDTYTTIPRMTPGMPRRRMHQSCPGIRLFFKKKGGERVLGWEYWVKLELKRKMKKKQMVCHHQQCLHGSWSHGAPFLCGCTALRSTVRFNLYTQEYYQQREREEQGECERITKWNDVGSHVLSSGFPPIHPLPLLGELIFPPFRFLVPATLKEKGK